VEGNRISFNATISACEKAGEWQQALQIFQQMAKDPWNNGEVKGKNTGYPE
jgi:pentatricopeptide repeat protein